MKCNMGKSDRWFRAVLGVAVLGVGAYFHTLWGLVGLVFLGTAAVGFCPLYWPVRFSTRKE